MTRRACPRLAVALGVIVALTASGCTLPAPKRAGMPGVRVLEPGVSIVHDLRIEQVRSGAGLGESPELQSVVSAAVVEEHTGRDTYTLTVRDIAASGEQRQVAAAQSLQGRVLTVDLQEGTVTGGLASTDDVAAADVALLLQVAAPLLPARDAQPDRTWTSRLPDQEVGWSQSPLRLSSSHRVVSVDVERGLELASIQSRTAGDVFFRLHIMRRAEDQPPPPEAPQPPEDQPYVIDVLFQQLFAAADHPIGAVAVAIAAIPLAVMAPFIALADGLSRLFRPRPRPSAPSTPQLPVVDMHGPLQLDSTTAVWTRDGRVLRSSGTGNLELAGVMPELPGQAATLSGTPVSITTQWTYTRTHAEPWPSPPDSRRSWLIGLALLLAFAAGVAAWLMRRRRRHALQPVQAPAVPVG